MKMLYKDNNLNEIVNKRHSAYIQYSQKEMPKLNLVITNLQI